MASDVWSLGIISTLLLTGEFVFENPENEYTSPATVLNAVPGCDLAEMDYRITWQDVSNLAKDFVHGLLIFNDRARLHVEQALEHGWFTDSTCRQDIQKQYEEAIRGWMPSRPLLDFKEDLAVFREASKSTIDVRSSLVKSLGAHDMPVDFDASATQAKFRIESTTILTCIGK